jgi:hypothetical protein
MDLDRKRALSEQQIRDNALGALDELQSMELYNNDRYPAYESEYWVRWEDIKKRVLPFLERIANDPRP